MVWTVCRKSLALGTISLVMGSTLFFSGCAENPGNWSQEEVEQATIGHFQLVDIDLKPDGGGGYTATGKTADGETLTIKVGMKPEAHRIEWSAEGDRGFVEKEGYYELK